MIMGQSIGGLDSSMTMDIQIFDKLYTRYPWYDYDYETLSYTVLLLALVSTVNLQCIWLWLYM